MKTIIIDEEKFEEIKDSEIKEALIFISQSKYWDPILKYITQRLEILDDNLRAIDPFSNPVDIARLQGQRLGMLDLLTAIEWVKDEKKEEAEKDREEKKK